MSPQSDLLTVASLSIILVGCSAPQNDSEPADSTLSLEHFFEQAGTHLPAESYMTNAFIPTDDALNQIPPPIAPIPLRIGMPWIDNDENAPWYIGLDQGYFQEAGLDVELVSGGPAVDHLLTLVSGQIDIAIINDSSRVTKLLASRTSGELTLIGAVLQSYPGIFLGIDHSVPKDQRSNLKITPEDFIGKRIGTATHSEFILDAVLEKHGIGQDQITKVRSGNDPTLLMAGRVDLMSAWIVNQPRLLEQHGYKNWTATRYAKLLYDEYSDVSVVRREWIVEQSDIIKRYLWALKKSMHYLLDNPKDAARITHAAIPNTGLTIEQILWRFETQRTLIMPGRREDILKMDVEVLDTITAYLLKYGIIEF